MWMTVPSKRRSRDTAVPSRGGHLKSVPTSSSGETRKSHGRVRFSGNHVAQTHDQTAAWNWVHSLSYQHPSSITNQIVSPQTSRHLMWLFKQQWPQGLNSRIVLILSLLFDVLDEFSPAESDIKMILGHLNLKPLPEDCQDDRFFESLCRLLRVLLKRGSHFFKMWLHETKLVLAALDVACEHLSLESPTVQTIVADLGSFDTQLTQHYVSTASNGADVSSGVPSLTESRDSIENVSTNVSTRIFYSKRFQDMHTNREFTNAHTNRVQDMQINRRIPNAHSYRIQGMHTTRIEGMKTNKRFNDVHTNRIQDMHIVRGNAEIADYEWQDTKPRRRKVDANFMKTQNFSLNERERANNPYIIAKNPSTKASPARAVSKKVTKKEIDAILLKLHEGCTFDEFRSRLPNIMNGLAVLCTDTNRKNKLDALSLACTTEFIDHLSACLEPSVLNTMGIPAEFYIKLIHLCLTFCRVLPEKAQLFATVVQLTRQAVDSVNLPHLPTQMLKALQDLHMRLLKVTYVSDGDPPDDFRDVSVVPTAADFLCQSVFLRPNSTQGSYQNENEYLDTHFRLLREDFMRPLRDAVSEIRCRSNSYGRMTDTRMGGVRIYKDVTFEKQSGHKVPGGLTMVFDRTRSLNIDWTMSKRFMMGSLLAISNDNFSTLYVAKVARRDIDLLNRGKLAIEVFDSNDNRKKLLKGGTFTVGESMVFFEPYFHVLNALQNTSTESFPLARYIVHAQSDGEMPDYLTQERNRLYRIAVGPEADEASVTIDIVSGAWPTPDALGLNSSQHEALVGALTQKVMLVQGPPGTGKTFLGLRVVRTLLQNPHAWRGDGQDASPILVVCYTNHALDQFLVGLLSATQSLVRLGGRCKDTRLQDYMLTTTQPDQLSVEVRRKFGKNRRAQQVAEDDLAAVQDALKALAEARGIVSYDTLWANRLLSEDEMRVFRSGLSVMAWLMDGSGGDAAEEAEFAIRPDRSNMYVTFQETFWDMSCQLRELSGRVPYEEALRRRQARYDFFESRASRVCRDWSDVQEEASSEDLLELNVDQ